MTPPPEGFIMPTCRIQDFVRVPGVLAAVGVPPLRHQLHGAGERSVTNLVGSRDFHQVDIPRLQLLQQGHCVGSCKQTETRIQVRQSCEHVSLF